MIRVSIVGATGYTGAELLRYLIRHPRVRLAHLTSESFSGKPVQEIHKFLKDRCSLVLKKLNTGTVAKASDVVFLGLPHGAAAKTAAALLENGARVIDLSADFRLEESALYSRWYGTHPVPKLLKEAVYGLPERYRDKIRRARLVANPGCYATTSILAGLPLAANGLLGKGPVIVDAKSGISGAGKKVDPLFQYCEANESMQAYGLKGHRHHPEIYQEWGKAAAEAKKGRALKNDFIFVPHLAPMNRGILATLYAPLAKKTTAEALRDVYAAYYQNEPFISILDAFVSPETKSVAYTNSCHLGVSVDPSGKHAIVVAALDNLVKGASGQAIQNMNLMFGLDETTGLL
ncbi:MAG: N-acetyl-gamma-glutamyl-phosphate reductase [Elusimicrobiota bacterium]|jgi:N-acetyl-gamma-glutamyl-phosphate reductase